MKNLLNCSLLSLSLLSFSHNVHAYEEQVYPTQPNPAFSYNSLARHYLYGLSAAQDLIELEDGSQWKVNPHDVYRLRNGNWHSNDPLAISANNLFFSSGGGYYITNLRTGAYVRALLSLGPHENTPYAYHISAVDHSNGYLYLQNGLGFALNRSQHKTYNNWIPGHTIILGSNDNWYRFSRYEYILINVDKNNFVEAEQY